MKTGPGFHPPQGIEWPEPMGEGVDYYPPGSYERDRGQIAGVCIGDYATGNEPLTKDEVLRLIAALQECVRRADA